MELDLNLYFDSSMTNVCNGIFTIFEYEHSYREAIIGSKWKEHRPVLASKSM